MNGKLIITLRAARVNRGYTLKDVSELLKEQFDIKVSADRINRYEFDSTNIPLSLMEKLLELYQVDMSNIFFGVESDFIGRYKTA